MDKFREFWTAWGPWISILLIPSLITGLSLYPKTKPIGNILSIIWNNVKKVLSALSITTFKDQSGTFQMPLKLGSIYRMMKPKKKCTCGPNEGCTKSCDRKTSSGAGGCAALLILSLSFSSQGCSWLKSTGTAVKDVAFDCSIQSIKTGAIQLVPAVIAILAGRAGNWKDQLSSFGKGIGQDILACAIREATKELLAKVSASGSSSVSPDTILALKGVTKGRVYVKEMGWKYVTED